MGHTWWGATLRATIPRLLRLRPARNRASGIARIVLFGQGSVRLQV